MTISLSVLIIVRDWSTQRLALSLASLQDARQGLQTEVILLDYGSQESAPYRTLAETYEAHYVREEAEVWSRSRAVNLAASAAKGEWLLFADADMLWSPRSLERSLEFIQHDENQFLVFQARDLPPSLNGESLSKDGYSWELLEQHASWRPRWGMGMQIVPATKFRQIQGFDERMVIWGAEDADIARRFRAIGLKQNWVNDPEVRVYHVWHGDSKQTANASEAGAKALKRNREILLKDPTVLRNVPNWHNRPASAGPLVSVVIVTRDRRLFLQEAIDSVLNQTFPDFEIVIIDDGTEGGIQDLVTHYQDSRLRYFKAKAPGVAAGRNFGADVSRGHYTAVHDDDDIMLPWSLEVRLRSLEAGEIGSYGGFWNFDDDTGDMELVPGKTWSTRAVYSGKTAGHPTMLVETEVIRRLRYDETIMAGSDYKFRVQLALAGYKLRHCGDVVTLRRMHKQNMSVVDLDTQRSTSDLVNAVTRFNMSKTERNDLRDTTRDKDFPVVELLPELASEHRSRPWMPNHLVTRVGVFRHEPAGSHELEVGHGESHVACSVSTTKDSAHYTLILNPAPKRSSQLEGHSTNDVPFALYAFSNSTQAEEAISRSLVVAALSSHEAPLSERPVLYTVKGNPQSGIRMEGYGVDAARSLLLNDVVADDVVLSPSLRTSSLASLMAERTV